MTHGEFILKLIQKRGWTQAEAARQAGIHYVYVNKIINGALKGGAPYEKLINALSIPHEIVVFMTFSADKIEDVGKRSILEKILPEIHQQLNVVFDSNIDLHE